jgi:putative oxidoreductase
MTLGVAAAALAMIGPGSASLDAALDIDVILDGWYGLAAAGVGVAAAMLQLAVFFRPVRETT